MTTNFFKKKSFIGSVSMVLIFLFVYTGIEKLWDHSLFEYQLHFYPVLKSYASIISWAVPVTELIIAILLFFPQTQQTGMLGSATLLILFTIYLAITVFGFSSRLPCSCGGIIQQLSWKQHILLNTTLIVLAVTGFYYSRQPPSAVN